MDNKTNTISKISFHGFKNLKGEYHLKQGINLLVKPNGWGKTNFLEAIDYISNLKSFRQIPDLELFNWSEANDFVKISIELLDKSKKQKKTAYFDLVISNGTNGSKINNGNKTKQVFINKVRTNPGKFKASLETILYSPHNADIVSSNPEIRRREFDRLLGEFSPNYAETLNEYKFVVRSRNKLLQKIRSSKARISELDYWNDRLAELGQNIIEARVVFLHEICPLLGDYAKKIFRIDANVPGRALLEIKYISRSLEENIIVLKERMEENVEKEVQAGMSLYGPHRDKFVFDLNDKALRQFGSRGQQRLAGLSLVFALCDYFNEKLGRYPILLLDDIMSELDNEHRKRIEKLLSQLKTQIFVTTSEKKYFSGEFIKAVNNIQ